MRLIFALIAVVDLVTGEPTRAVVWALLAVAFRPDSPSWIGTTWRNALAREQHEQHRD